VVPDVLGFGFAVLMFVCSMFAFNLESRTRKARLRTSNIEPRTEREHERGSENLERGTD